MKTALPYFLSFPVSIRFTEEKAKKSLDKKGAFRYNITVLQGKEGNAMVLDVRPILRGETRRMDIAFDLTPQPVFDVSFPEAAHVSGTLTDDGGYMRLSLTATLPYVGHCARCLSPVGGTFTLDFSRTVAAEGSMSEERLAEMDDAYVMIRGGRLEVDDLIREEILMCFPMRLLCREDCPGLCPRCGKPLSEGKCDCPEKEIDPRLAVLKKWVDKQENP